MIQNTQKDLLRILRALSVEKRLEIIQLLAERTLCVGALSNLLGISAGAVSQHLRILKDAGLVEPDRRGYFIHYRIAPDAAERCGAVTDSIFGSKHGNGKCSAKQIKDCHGNVKKQPCAIPAGKRPRKS